MTLGSSKKLKKEKEILIFQLTIKDVWTIIWRVLRNQAVWLLINIRKIIKTKIKIKIIRCRPGNSYGFCKGFK